MRKAGWNPIWKWLAIIAMIFLLAPLAIALLNGPGGSSGLYPSPNAYETISNASRSITRLPFDYDTSDDVEMLKEYVESNREALSEIDKALTQQSRVPLDYTVPLDELLNASGTVRLPMRLLIVQARVAELEENPGAAADVYAKMSVLSPKLATGGLLVHVMIASAYETMALEKLIELTPRLSAVEKKRVLSVLTTNARKPIDFDLVRERESDYCKHEHGTVRGSILLWSGSALVDQQVDRAIETDDELLRLRDEAIDLLGS
ncbi:MAG: hypothetical protein HKN47_22450 [Pirellulaceae bacterium]|nr:hypothetical protein [Pirellulaceae bacterium]